MNPERFESVLQSPIGPLCIQADRQALRGVFLLPAGGAPRGEESALTRTAALELAEYFEGRRRRFDLPLRLTGTEFQQRVWRILATLPYGGATSYQAIAQRLGKPGAARAVGGAVGKNPFPILLPCHRVLGREGALGGFRLGLDAKRRLLTLEGIGWK